MNKLICVPIPRIEESPYSLIRRATLAHGFPTVGHFAARCLGPRSFESFVPHQSSPLVVFLAKEAGQHRSLVLSGFYQLAERAQYPHLTLRGMEFPSTLIRLRTAAFCDDCVKEAYQRQIQDLKLAEYCPYHQKKYLTHCPQCEKKISWWHALDGCCSYCATRLCCPSCSAEDCATERALLEILRTQNQEALDRILRYSRKLGYTAEKRNTTPAATRRQIIEAAFLIAADEPNAILKHLSALRDLYPEISKQWITARFGPIDSPALTIALNAFIVDDSPTKAHSEDAPPFLLTSLQVRKKLITDGGWKFITARNGRSTVTARTRFYTEAGFLALEKAQREYYAKSLGRLPMNEDQMWTAKRAARELQVPQTTLHLFAKIGVINSYSGKKSRKFFIPDDIHSLLARYEPPSHIAVTCNVASQRIYKVIRKLDIRPAYNEELHWPSWLLTKEDGLRIRTELTAKKQANVKAFPLILPRLPMDSSLKENYIAFQDAAAQLKFCKQVLHALIKWHYIKNACRARKQIYIPRSEVKRVKQTLITCGIAGEKLKIASHRVSDLLATFGVYPIYIPENVKRNLFLYRIKDVMKVARKTAHEKSTEKDHYLTTSSAAARLCLSHDIIRCLARNQLLIHKAGKLSMYFRPSHLGNFIVKHRKLCELLRQFGYPQKLTCTFIDNLVAHPVVRRTRSSRAICLLISAEIVNYFRSTLVSESYCFEQLFVASLKLPQQAPETSSDDVGLEPILQKYNIVHSDFYRTFIKHGFIHALTVKNHIKYLTLNDSARCCKILESYITCAMADRLIFHHGGTTKSLITRQILKDETPFPGRIVNPLISRQKLASYVASHPVSSLKKPN